MQNINNNAIKVRMSGWKCYWTININLAAYKWLLCECSLMISRIRFRQIQFCAVHGNNDIVSHSLYIHSNDIRKAFSRCSSVLMIYYIAEVDREIFSGECILFRSSWWQAPYRYNDEIHNKKLNMWPVTTN